MTHNVLWLDDHFDEFGEITPPVIEAPRVAMAGQPDRLLDMDRRQLEEMLPDVHLFSETRVNGFTQQLINHIRLARSLPVRVGRAHTFSALVIDIMITGTTQIPYPVLDSTGNVGFDDSGRVTEWVTAYTQGNGFDAGLVIAEQFIYRESHLSRLPCIFYTHRNIDDTVDQRISAIRKRGGIAYAFEKLYGAEQVIKQLRESLRVT